MRFLWTLLFLAACGAQPSPKFFGAHKHEILRSGRHYVVWDNGERHERGILRDGGRVRRFVA
ncbi:hypothetical protein [Cereibacter changlensis]|uniref:hypothetical protein n=1 Tax=Cereibacter changlensis TaxID=402884 RepID=UPI0040333910